MASDDDNALDGPEAREAIRDGLRIFRDTRAEIENLLKKTRAKIEAVLAGSPKDWEQRFYPQLKRQIDGLLALYGEQVADAASRGAEASWAAGQRMVDAPLAAAGFEAELPRIDRAQLDGLKRMLTWRIKGATAAQADRIGRLIGLVVTGAHGPQDAIAGVQATLGAGRRRALTIVRTELGRAFSNATFERLKARAKRLPGLKKQWRRSGKLHSRRTHDLADGQVREVETPFLVAGEKLMYPRDPEGSPGNTINCGCTMLSYMSRWAVLHPREKPFDDREIVSPGKREILDVRDQGFGQWVDAVLSGRARPDGAWQTVGSLPPSVAAAAAARGVNVTTNEFALGDKQLLRMRRPAKDRAGIALPADLLADLPKRLAAPDAVYWVRKGAAGNQVVLALETGDPERVAAFVVRLDAHERRLTHQRHNVIVSGGMARRSALRVGKAYERLAGGV